MGKVQDFEYNDWTFEMSSGYRGFRNKKTNDWIYEVEFVEMKDKFNDYIRDYELISHFRSECLPFGEYPEYVIQEFLDKKYNKKKEEPEQEDKVEKSLPTTVEEAVELLIPRFKGADEWFNKTEGQFQSFCHSITLSGGIGMQIRNEFGLWEEDGELHKHIKDVHGVPHPDDMSGLILRELYKQMRIRLKKD